MLRLFKARGIGDDAILTVLHLLKISPPPDLFGSYPKQKDARGMIVEFAVLGRWFQASEPAVEILLGPTCIWPIISFATNMLLL